MSRVSLFRDVQRARVCAQEALLSVDIGGCRHRCVVCALNGNGGRERRTSDMVIVVIVVIVVVSLALSLAAVATWCLVVLPIRDLWTARLRHALVVRRVS